MLKVQVRHLKVPTFLESPHSQNTLIHKQAATVVHYIDPDGRYPDICLDIYDIDPDGKARCPPTDQPILLNVFKIISSQINVRKLDNLHSLLDGLSSGHMVRGVQKTGAYNSLSWLLKMFFPIKNQTLHSGILPQIVSTNSHFRSMCL